MAERDVAIVSDIPGTTRDALETRVVLGGVPVTLVDTAGVRESWDSIEAEGVRRAIARAAEADLAITVIEAGSLLPGNQGNLVVAKKADLGRPGPEGALRISAKTGLGMDDLWTRLAVIARQMTEVKWPASVDPSTASRCTAPAADHLEAAERADLPELRGEDLRLAMRALGRITGHVGVEDILDTVFSRFCIGK